MATPSAKDMLGQIKRYAEGGDVAQSQSAGLTYALGSGLTQDQFYANIRDYASKNTNQLEALNTMSQYGISMADVNAALGATAVKEYFTVDPNAGEKAPGSVQTDFTSGLQQEVANNPNLDQAGLDSRIKATVAQYSGNPDKLRELFVQNQTSIADLQRAGVDPSVLYSTRAVTTPVTTPDTIGKNTGITTAPPVYKPLPEPPPIYKPGEPALDQDFRNSPPRTYDDTYGYMYTPAAKLLSATGSGMSFTPPSVTSRPRSLLNIPLATTANPQLSASQQFARDAPQRAAAQLAAMPATGSRFTGTAPASQSGELRFYAPPALPGPGFDAYGNPIQEYAEGGAVKKTGGTADSSARTLLDNLNNMLDNLNSEAPAKRNLPKEAQDARRARIGQAPAVAQDYSGRDLTGELLNVASLATAPVPVLGDIAGLAADARMYQMRPEERTMGNYLLSAAGVLPFVPSVSAIKTVGKAADDLAALAKAPLDLSQGAKEARATEQRYTPTLYHGTSSLDNVGFDEFNKKFYGSATNSPSAKLGTWLTDDPTTANIYAFFAPFSALQNLQDKYDNAIRKLLKTTGDTLQGEARIAARKEGRLNLAPLADKIKQATEALQAGVPDPDEARKFFPLPARIGGGGGANIMPVRARGNFMEYDAGDTSIRELQDKKGLTTLGKEAKEAGYDGLKITNFRDPINAPSATHYLVFDPKNIRSVNADFDPEKLDSANLGHAKGGLIQKYATGGDVAPSTADLRAQMDRIAATPHAKTPSPTSDLRAQLDRIAATPNAKTPAPDKRQTESRSMLDKMFRFYEQNISKPMVGSVIDMTLGLGDLGQMGVKYLANRAGIETEPFAPIAPRMKEAAGVADYNPYAIGALATNILPFAGASKFTAAGTKLLPNLGREAAAYAGSELGAAAAREVLPDSTGAELLASFVGSAAAGGNPMSARNRDTAIANISDEVPTDDVVPTDSARMLNELDASGSLLAPQTDVPVVGGTGSVRPEITSDIGDRSRVGTTGRYVGAPEGINTPQKLAGLTRSIMSLTKEGEFGRFWYERSGRQILDVTGGNKEDAEKIIQAIAITSANTPVAGNFDFALQAYYQWKNGEPIKTGMYTTAMSKKLQKMFDGEDWAGRKTNNFYNNLMREVDPSKVQGVTTDLWMMRAFGFDKDAPTDAQYSFVENETKRIAQNLGWEPQQVQASIWVALKSRMENAGVKSAVEAKSLKNGWLKYDADGERVILDKNKHAANWLDTAMKYSPNDADRKAAGFDYADAAKNNLAQISWETRPSRTSMHMPEIFDATPEVVQDFHVAMSKSILDDKGGDSIAKELGALSPGDFEAPGYFEGLTSPGTQTLVTVPRAYGVTRRINEIKNQAKVEGWEKPVLDAALRKATYATEPAAKDLMLAYAAVRGILFKQDGVGLHRPSFIEGLSRPKANGIEIDIGRPLTADETTRLAQLVANGAGHAEFNPIGSANGIRFINFDYVKTDNAQFQKIINNALKENVFDNGEVANAKMFGADTDYLGNNWTENLNGESYMDSGNLAGRPDLQRKIRDIVNRLAPRISAVEEEFSNRHGWTRNRELNRAYETTDQNPIGIAPSTLPVEEGIGSLPTKKLEGQSANTDGTAPTPMGTAAVTTTPKFKNWFGESKVVNADGKPLMVYHGTGSTNIEQFLPDGGRDEGARTLKVFLDAKAKNEKFGFMNFRSGSFFSPDAKYAGNYTGENNGVMYPVYIKAENPVYFDTVTGKKSIMNKNATPDAMFIMDGDKILEIAVIDPTQVKSAIGNEGTFDPTNPAITKAKGGIITKKAKGGNVERVYNDRKYI